MVSHRSDVPFRLGVFLAVGDAEQIARPGDHDEHVVAEHDEPRREIADQAGAAGALDDVERGGEQHVAAEGEDHRRSVQRPQAAEIEPRRDVEPGIGELEGDVDAHRHARHAPEQGGEGAELDRPEIVVGLAVDFERRRVGRPRRVALEDGEDRPPRWRRRRAPCGTRKPARWSWRRHRGTPEAGRPVRLISPTSPPRIDFLVVTACI